MKHVHNLSIRVLCKQIEDSSAFKEALECFLPENASQEGFSLTQEEIRIDQGEDLISLELSTDKQRWIKHILSFLGEHVFTQNLKKLREEDDRVDQKGAWYLRFDKTAFLNDSFELVDHGQCIHVRFLLAAFPKSRENAIATKNSLLEHYSS